MTASETALFDRVRKSDTCPPSLLKEGGFGEGDDGFAAAVLSVLDGATGIALRSDVSAGAEFDKPVKVR